MNKQTWRRQNFTHFVCLFVFFFNMYFHLVHSATFVAFIFEIVDSNGITKSKGSCVCKKKMWWRTSMTVTSCWKREIKINYIANNNRVQYRVESHTSSLPLFLHKMYFGSDHFNCFGCNFPWLCAIRVNGRPFAAINFIWWMVIRWCRNVSAIWTVVKMLIGNECRE